MNAVLANNPNTEYHQLCTALEGLAVARRTQNFALEVTSGLEVMNVVSDYGPDLFEALMTEWETSVVEHPAEISMFRGMLQYLAVY